MSGEGKIFLLAKDGSPTAVINETDFSSEDRLQAEIERQPELIPGDQITPEQPRRWLLVKREIGIPDSESGGNRWSLDHLFIDQDATPTFVECKLSRNPEVRREVVAQMLEYAANGTKYWPPGRIREAAAQTAEEAGDSLHGWTSRLLGKDDEGNVEDFWASVDTNLADGNIRLVFAANRIPRELQTIVDFLNDQMVKTDVVAVEIKLFQGEDFQALVPRVTGRSAFGRAAQKSSSIRNRVTLESLVQSIERDDYRGFIDRLFSKCQSLGLKAEPGDLGTSWRIETPKRVTVLWYFPSGRSGWMGLKDLTFGYDHSQADGIPEQNAAALRRYAQSLSELGAEDSGKDWISGIRFNPDSVLTAESAVFDALDNLAASISNGD
ncbi:MAG: hypothetical protein IIC93_10695 [Chloroflexi bacterium]|nr:hypothetical protein [Chloroflexota bacterium]